MSPLELRAELKVEIEEMEFARQIVHDYFTLGSGQIDWVAVKEMLGIKVFPKHKGREPGKVFEFG